jgi:hypothetical protein
LTRFFLGSNASPALSPYHEVVRRGDCLIGLHTVGAVALLAFSKAPCTLSPSPYIPSGASGFFTPVRYRQDAGYGDGRYF